MNAQYATVLAYKNYGTISEITISNIDLDAKYSTGAIATTNYADAIIKECDVKSGSVTVYNATSYSDVYGGGIVGTNNGSVKNCYNGASVSVTGDRNVVAGGIVGYSTAATTALSSVIGCSNSGDITTTDLNTGNGYDYAGGITGSHGGGYFDVIECYNTGNITAGRVAGGICGKRPYGSTNVINNCWNSGIVKATTTSTSDGSGGISGNGGNAIVKNCLNVGDVLTGANGEPLLLVSSGSQPGAEKLVNSYAIDGCVKGITETTTISGSLYYGYDETENRIGSGVTQTQLKDGTVLASLNAGNTEPVWGQIEGGEHPILLNNNDLTKTQITIQGVTAVDKVYTGTANLGYTGTITTTPEYDTSKITVTYKGTLADGTSYESDEAPIDAGEYVVVFETPASDLVYSGELTLSFKITKAAASDVTKPEGKEASINTTLNDIVLDEGWSWKDNSIKLDTLGTVEYDVYYTLTDEQVANYDYSSIEGYNEEEKRIEYKLPVTVTMIKITFDNVDDVQFTYGSTITIDGTPKIGESAMVKDTDYVAEIYSIDSDGKVLSKLDNIPTDVAKYLVFINVDNVKYDSTSYEIIKSEPITLLGEDAEVLSTTYDCVYILEIVPVVLSVNHGQTTIGYTSQPVYARPIIKNGTTTLVEGTDYTIKYYEVNEGIVRQQLTSNPINIGTYLYVITLNGTYASDVYGFEGGIPSIISETTTVEDLKNYSCCSTLIIGNASGGGVDSSELDALNKAIEELKLALDTKADKTALAEAITNLTSLIEAAEETAKNANDELQTLLEGKIKEAQETLEQSIKDLDAKLDQAISDLEAVDKENSAALAQAIIDLTDLIETTKAALAAANSALRADLEKQLATAVDALDYQIKDLRSALDHTQAVLAASDKENAEALAQAIVDLTALIKAAEVAAKVSDEALKLQIEEAEKNLNDGLEALREALKAAEDQAAKDNAELEEKLTDADAKDKEELLGEIKSAIILPTVIGFVSLAGNIALLAYILIKRKK